MEKLQVEHNSFASFYRDPFGAVPQGSSIGLRIRVMMKEAERPDGVLLCLKEDGEEIVNEYNMEQESASGSFTYSYKLTVQDKPQLLWYYFKLIIDNKIYYYGKENDGYGGTGQLFQTIPPPYQITVFKSDLKTPAWVKDAVIYQIFVDRFYNGNQGQKVLNPKKNSLLQSHWSNEPVYIRDDEGRIIRWSFFGGNLIGVKNKLPYLKKLGINLIYFNPIFRAASNHKYDIGDYHSIDEMFGDKELFEELIEEAEKMGISVILDGVFSHTGSDSIYFNKEDNYDSRGAYQTKESPYYNWYKFENYPHDYECWWGVEDLPEVDELNPSYQDFIIYDKDSVLKYWMKAGIKGWRLDVADELPGEFIGNFREVMKQCDSESVLIGEVWEDASNKISYGSRRQYLLGERLDSVTNYPLRSIMLDFLSGSTDAEFIHRALMTLYENYPRVHFYSTMNMLGNHDLKRILTELKERQSSRQNHYDNNIQTVDKTALKQLKLLILWQMTFPGMPTIYYGDEAGLEGGKDPENRRPYPWGEENEELLAWYRELICINQEFDMFKTGAWISLPAAENVYGYVREITDNSDVFEEQREDNTALILINRDVHEKFELNLDTAEWFADGRIYDLLECKELEVEGGQLSISLKPLSGRIFTKQQWPQKLKEQREAGVLLHVTSLPSPYGIGDMGQNAFRFIDFLEETGQSCWQVLPLNPPGSGNSPYQCYSSFAGNAMLIDPEGLAARGWLEKKDLQSVPEFSQDQVDFAEVEQYKHQIFRRAWQNFKKSSGDETEAYQNFTARHSYWLPDYSLFMALKDKFNNKVWTEWPQAIARYRPGAVKKYTEILQEEIGYHKFLQYVFFDQWQQLQQYASEKNVKIMGDLPIFAGHNSSDVWAHSHLFKLNEDGTPIKVAGVPPDAFSDTGQRWGNPVYRWHNMSTNNYQWWQQRLKVLEEMMDMVRIDHFRGFEAAWEIPAEEETAVKGHWAEGPGQDFFDVVMKEIEGLSLVAEDLGYITPEVEELKIVNNLPGMKVMQFMIDPDEEFKLPFHQYNNYLYSGTHDNKTLRQWYQDNFIDDGKKQEFSGSNDETAHICWHYIEELYKSPALKVIIPLQDILLLGAEARMNVPGTAAGNWKWRVRWQQIDEDKQNKLKIVVSEYNRK